jgi:transcriptional regulator with XRE-family HTH domain
VNWLPEITDLQERRRLGQELRRLRERTGLSGSQFARQLGWHQTRVSKLELGQQFPTEDDIRAWATAAGDIAAAERMLALRDAAQMAYRTFRQQFRDAGGAAGRQADIAAMEALSAVIGEFEPAIIPGRLQTYGYAHEVLRLPSGPGSWGESAEDIERAARTRVELQQQILYDTSKRIRVVLHEAALRIRYGPADTMLGQLDRLLSLTGLPSLELGIIPFKTAVPVLGLSGFIVYDDQLVIVETLTGEQQLSDQAEVSRYMSWFDLLRKAAVSGRDAAAIIQAAMAVLRVSPPGALPARYPQP